ncbi:MAG: phosphate signaling complex protein PhoU [Spirochaetes bacterium]|nr:phosphate signaling complex protein PhoU [Spirochaetota bacterium]
MKTRNMLSEELNKLRQELALMAARVDEDLGKAIAVLQSGDKELAKEVKASGKLVDAMQLKIEDMALVLLATQQPVARDLRELITVFKLTTSLERIGDYSVHLVKAAIKLSGEPLPRSVERIERMALAGREMLKAAFSAYISHNAEAAREAAGMDHKIDSEHKALTEEALVLMKSNPELVKAAARLLRLSGFMERLGDHVTNICEGIVFMTDGKREALND